MKATVRVYVNDEDDEILNTPPKRVLVDFHFDPGLFAGYWIDHEDKSVVFYIATLQFRTPLTRDTVEMFDIFLNDRGIILS